MKKIKDVTFYDRMTLIPMIQAIKGDAGMIHSGVKILQKLDIKEEEAKLGNLRKGEETKGENSNSIYWSPNAPVIELCLEDRDFEFLNEWIFKKKDTDKTWDMNTFTDVLIQKFSKPEDC